MMAGAGVIAGAAVGFMFARLAGRFFLEVKMPGPLPVVISAFVLMAVAVLALLLPAARVDVMQALRSEGGSQTFRPLQMRDRMA
jgi:ABC-type antimicrobial peptide transport system permease subunit